jgi:Na+-driven multidrug efflux pump
MPMTDLTKGSIAGHIVSLAVPIFGSTMTFMLWLLVDMYFVAVIGKAAVAGIGAAGNVSFLTSALTLVLSAGTMALVAQAVGRKIHRLRSWFSTSRSAWRGYAGCLFWWGA